MFTLEKEGNYKGYEYFVIASSMGHRCGYVSIPKGHELHGKEYDEIEIQAHGGLTFSGKHRIIERDYLIGFDCAHWGDARDYSLMDDKMMKIYSEFGNDGKIWSAEDVEEECKNIIKQL